MGGPGGRWTGSSARACAASTGRPRPAWCSTGPLCPTAASGGTAFTPHRMIMADMGHVGENLYLGCAALGLGTCGIGAYDQKLCDSTFQLDGEEEFTLYTQTVGDHPPRGRRRGEGFFTSSWRSRGSRSVAGQDRKIPPQRAFRDFRGGFPGPGSIWGGWDSSRLQEARFCGSKAVLGELAGRGARLGSYSPPSRRRRGHLPQRGEGCLPPEGGRCRRRRREGVPTPCPLPRLILF